jgi:hypothetical protein
MYKDTYEESEKKIKKEVLYYASFCIQIADMVNPANKKELMDTMQREALKVSRKVVKY